MPDEIKLLPCPFCGGEAYIFTSDDDKPRWVSCNDCEADGPHCQAVSDVVKGWNHRASLVEGLPQADNSAMLEIADTAYDSGDRDEVWIAFCKMRDFIRQLQQ